MKEYFLKTGWVWLMIIMIAPFQVSGQQRVHDPVTPGALPETRALLHYLQGISGQYTLSGQHNYPASGDRNTRYAKVYIGETPVIWSQDFGFAAAGDKDSYLSRPAIVQEAIRQHQKGAIITLCWHAVPPTAEEPVTFMPKPGSEGRPLASVQGKLTESQFRDILTPGTPLYQQWLKQVDEIAKYLKMLQEAKVPVLWRPYHEMNGDWFWWGGHSNGAYTTAALYRQLFDRFVNYHKLKNLIWVWSVDRPTQPSRAFSAFYPGDQYVDILALDVYGNDFNPSYYQQLVDLSKGKPVTLGEVGNPPKPEILNEQPRWIYWVVWAGMVRNTPYTDYQALIDDPRVLFREDPAYTRGTVPYRKKCGLEPLMVDRAADFSGSWKLNECESDAGTGNFNGIPYQLNLNQKGDSLKMVSFTVVEWEGDRVVRQTLPLDGREITSQGTGGFPVVQTASFNPLRDTLRIHSSLSVNRGTWTYNSDTDETWTLLRGGRKLMIHRVQKDGRRTQEIRLIYDKL